MCNGEASGHALVGSSLLGLQVTTSQVHGSNECPLLDWIVLSPAELSAVFGVDVSCQLLRKDTGIPQYVLFVPKMQCLGFLYTCTLAALLLSQSRADRTYGRHDFQKLSEISLECVNRKEYLYAPIECNVIASQIMDFCDL